MDNNVVRMNNSSSKKNKVKLGTLENNIAGKVAFINRVFYVFSIVWVHEYEQSWSFEEIKIVKRIWEKNDYLWGFDENELYGCLKAAVDRSEKIPTSVPEFLSYRPFVKTNQGRNYKEEWKVILNDYLLQATP